MASGENTGGKYGEPLWGAVVSGTVGGAVAVVVGYPFESVKVRLQTGNKSRLFSSLFLGVSAPLVAVTPQWALMYCSYFYSQSVLSERFSPVVCGALSGALCGLVISTVVAPVDAVKIRAQNEKKPALRVLDARLLGHGFFATAVHLGLSQAVFFATYEYALARLGSADESHLDWRPAMAGGLAGIVEWTACMSTDTVKTRLQAGPLGVSYWDVWKTTYVNHGLRGFYRGYLPILLRAVPVNSSAYFVIEFTNALLQRARRRRETVVATISDI